MALDTYITAGWRIERPSSQALSSARELVAMASPQAQLPRYSSPHNVAVINAAQAMPALSTNSGYTTRTESHFLCSHGVLSWVAAPRISVNFFPPLLASMYGTYERLILFSLPTLWQEKITALKDAQALPTPLEFDRFCVCQWRDIGGICGLVLALV